MMLDALRAIKRGINTEISRLDERFSRRFQPGKDPFIDIRALTVAGESPTVFDIGGNRGQSILNFRKRFRVPLIHSFEPNPRAFADLTNTAGKISGVRLNNVAIGSFRGTKIFVENSMSHMSSFFEPGETCWGQVIGRHPLPVTTFDDYCRQEGIDTVDILKSDTQGFELEVLKGAADAIANHRIHMIYIEVIFSPMYVGMPPFYETLQFLKERGLQLVSFYKMYYQNERLSWTDALFIDPKYTGSVQCPI